MRVHFTPTNSSWLIQVEIWLAKIKRDSHLARQLTSFVDLSGNLLEYIRYLCQDPNTLLPEVHGRSPQKL